MHRFLQLMQSKMRYLDEKQIKKDWRNSETDTINAITGLPACTPATGDRLHFKKRSNLAKNYTGFSIFYLVFTPLK